MCVAAAIAGGAVVGAVGSNMAADKQASGLQNAADTQRNMFNRIQGYEQPFREAGVGATNQLSDLLGTSGNTGAQGYGSLTSSFTPQDYLANQDPGYQFQLQQGQQAIRNADTPGVGALSGPALKDLMTFNQGTAATGYNNAFNRFQTQNNNIFSRLSGIAGLGQNAASNTGTVGTTLGQGVAGAQAYAGAAQGSGISAGTNAIGQNAIPLGYLMGANNQGGFDSSEGGNYYGAQANAGVTNSNLGFGSLNDAVSQQYASGS